MKKDKPFYNSTIPSDWTTPEFGEVFTFLKSYSFSREQLSDEKTTDGIQNIHYGDIHATFEDEILDFEIEKRIPFVKDGLISTDKLSDEEFPFLKDGDLIIADASEDTIGVAECVELKNVNGRKIVSGLHTFAARDKKGKTVPGYRTYLLRHPQVIRELRRIATGFSVFGISKTNLTKVRLPLPPHNEQEAFAELLNLMDTAINKNNQLIAKKESHKKVLMQQLITGKKRLKSFEKEKYTETTLGEIGRISKGKGILKEEVSETGFPCIRYGEIYTTHNFIVKKFKSFISEDIAKESKRISKGDILFAGSGETLEEIGKAIAFIGDEIAYAGGDTIILSPNDTVDSEYISYVLETDFVRRQKRRFGQGHSVVHIYGSDIAKLKIRIPKKDEQIAIAKVLQLADTEIQILRDKTIKLKNKKRGLIQQLLSGKKRLPTKSK
jgi:type I restriction enzyme S subunit